MGKSLKIEQSVVLGMTIICLLIFALGGSMYFVTYATVARLITSSQTVADDMAQQTSLVRSIAQAHSNVLWILSENNSDNRLIRKQVVDGFIAEFDAKLIKCGTPCQGLSNELTSYKQEWNRISVQLIQSQDLNQFKTELDSKLNPLAEVLFDHLDHIAGDATKSAKARYLDTQDSSLAYLKISAAGLAFILILAAGFFIFIRSWILKPLESLGLALKQVKLGFDIRFAVESVRATEIKEIGQTFNEMVANLKDNEQTIRHQNELMIQNSKMASLGQMSAGVAHEVNNPLAIISGSLQQIHRTIPPNSEFAEKIHRYVDRSQGAVDRISKIVAGLKSYARDSTQEEGVETPVQKVLQNVVELCREKFGAAQVRFNLAPVPPLVINCRISEIERVFINLLNNSIDAVAALPEERRWTKVDFLQTETSLKIRVSDGGPRIPDAVAAKIMDPFFTTKEIGKGTGLGLSISVGIVQEHGGNLTLDRSQPFTCFVVDLPIRKGAVASTAA